jgi:excisionase family DNA binding protein
MSEIDPTTTPELLRIEDVAYALDVTMRTVERLIADGVIAETRIGGSVRIRRDELNRYISAQTRHRGRAA